ncbi:MAG: hypothetical protein RLZZ368_1172, partial [Actinomycetota bacterium]
VTDEIRAIVAMEEIATTVPIATIGVAASVATNVPIVVVDSNVVGADAVDR